MQFAYGMDGAMQIDQQHAFVVATLVYKIAWVVRKGVLYL